MLSNIKLQFDSGEFEEIDDNDLYSYEKKENVTGIDAEANTSEMSLSFLKDFFPSLQTLMLSNSKLEAIRDIGYNYSHLTVLSLTYCDLTTLDGISQISLKIEELYLAHNKISDIKDLIGMNELQILDLEDNQISNLDDIEVLSQCINLEVLTLRGNPSAVGDDYRQRVRYLLPDLKYLDEVKFLAHETRSKLSNLANTQTVSDNEYDDDYNDEDSESFSSHSSSKPYTAPVTFETKEQKDVLLKDMYQLKPITLGRKTKTPINSHQQAVIKKPTILKKPGISKVVLGKLKPLC